MAATRTEQTHRHAAGLDTQPTETILRLLATAQFDAASVVLTALEPIAAAATLIADTLRAEGRIAYAAAGSSGLMAVADALELPGTFGIARDRIELLLAEGASKLLSLPGAPEDDEGQAAHDVAQAAIGKGDCLIALSASGTTPYAVAALKKAKAAGVATVGIANNEGTPLISLADIAVLLPTPPEIIAGSTRLGAATAQKITLNMMSTLAAIHLGHVHDGYMINLRADNKKLRSRAARIVAAISGEPENAAANHLEMSGGAVKEAVLLAAGAGNLGMAKSLLDGADGNLRQALAELDRSARSSRRGT
ncbi:N-acetylmuramic acid 6-phosphate etherase [Mesorhizobium sp. BAC0120]|uniref:N-acetylmuramic acid 6-phosphate etherase n=1 Tax=Mesorhizobium sp. BAC0120 TaxID=3090670 RepID=UPI00298CB53B|nr:N-acetylmuramic acid 6-phosphate etherase [Mesorhizobium sp. BAC0120]MDW6026645.1 N-acetylmuramic acid 6-phosphate etherase [Mesorhizobium sp. BAC0120]